MNTLSHQPEAATQRRVHLLSQLQLSHHGQAHEDGAPTARIGPPEEPAARAPAPPAAVGGRRLPSWAIGLLVVQGCALAAFGFGRWGGGAGGNAIAAAAAHPSAAASAPVAAPAGPAVRFEASGFIEAMRTATVSARTMGQVAEVLVDEGARVRRGQVLARLADAQARTEISVAQAQQDAAQARLGAAQAQLEEAQRDLSREQYLRDHEFTSDARLSKTITQRDLAQSAVTSARADVALVALQVQHQVQALDDYTVRAPFDGVVLARNAQVGEIVAPGGAGGGYTRTGIYTIVDMHSLEITVDVNEDMLGKVEAGRRVRAELYAHKGWQVDGEVLRVMPNADRAKSTVRVHIRLLEDDPRILPDMAVKVLFL